MINPLVRALARHWWLIALRGILAILFGIGCLIWPGIALLSLVFLFGAYAGLDGIFLLFTGVTRRSWLTAFEGVVGIVAAIVTFVWPGMTALVLLYVIAFWAVFTGIMKIVAAIQLRQYIRGEWLYVVQGLLTVIFGLIMFGLPVAGALAVVWLIGIYGIIFGILALALSLRLLSIKV